jgi:hypothetical protein
MKKNKSIHFDLICSPNDLTVKQTSFMIMGMDTLELNRIYKSLVEVINNDFGHASDFQLVIKHDMFYVKTKEETDLSLIPYLVEKMRKYI